MEDSKIDVLNRRFGIPGVAQVLSGNGGLPKLRVTAPSASAEIYLHGAHLTSWTPANAEETIFVSEHSHWQDGQAIRGGIPICFPWFRAKADDPKAPTHGFVRTKEWNLDSVSVDGESVTVICSTESDESTRRWWPHEFRLAHVLTIGRSLRLQLIVTNTGQDSFRFEEALHTYFRVGQAKDVLVRGLDGVTYLDNVDGNREKVQPGDLRFTTKTDNAYLNTRSAVELIDPILHRTLRTEKENSATTIVWNPWQEGAASLSDFGDEEWQGMACVEASNMLGAAVSLAPGGEHTRQATLSIVR